MPEALSINLKVTGISEVTRFMMQLPGNCTRARTAALKSCAFMVQQDLRRFIEAGGEGWSGLHPITSVLRKRHKKDGKPLFWLARFARYRVSADGATVGIGLGRSKSGQPGEIDSRWLMIAAAHAEEGYRQKVTPGIRRAWLRANKKSEGWTRAVRSGRRGKIRSGAYLNQMHFALAPETQTLIIPRRPIFAPVFRNVQGRIGRRFEDKFWPALEAYNAGRSPRQTKDS